MSGTAAEIVPISSVDDRVVGDGTPGPVTRKIQDIYKAAVRGRVDRYRSWVEHAS
jgi:branched-chain amino acid aminotransferase